MFTASTVPTMFGSLEAYQVTSSGVTLSWPPVHDEGGAPVFSYQISMFTPKGWIVVQVSSQVMQATDISCRTLTPEGAHIASET